MTRRGREERLAEQLGEACHSTSWNTYRFAMEMSHRHPSEQLAFVETLLQYLYVLADGYRNGFRDNEIDKLAEHLDASARAYAVSNPTPFTYL